MKGDRLIRLLLHLYPTNFRGRYGEEMLAFHCERIAHASVLNWAPIVADHIAAAAR